MTRSTIWMRRVAIILALAVVLPACGRVGKVVQGRVGFQGRNGWEGRRDERHIARGAGPHPHLLTRLSVHDSCPEWRPRKRTSVGVAQAWIKESLAPVIFFVALETTAADMQQEASRSWGTRRCQLLSGLGWRPESVDNLTQNQALRGCLGVDLELI